MPHLVKFHLLDLSENLRLRQALAKYCATASGGHHSRLRQNAEIGHLFAADDATFATRIKIIAAFFVEACGGPAAYSATEGDDVCIRTRHFPFEIDERAREIWLENLCIVLEERELSEKMRDMYWAWLEAMSIRMINRRRTKAQPVRFSYAEARRRFL